MADDFDNHSKPSSSRRSPFVGGPTPGSSSSYRFPKIQPLPSSTDISYDDEHPNVSQHGIIQVEEPERAPSVRTLPTESGNEAEPSSGEEDDVETKAKSQLQKTASRARRNTLSTGSARKDGRISSLLIEPVRKVYEPLRTRIIRILCWQLLISIVLCLPFLIIVDFIPFLNIVTIPITSIFGTVLFFDVAFIAYLMLAQTDPPDSVTLPFLPWNFALVRKVNYVLYRWLRVGAYVAPRLMRDWAFRRMLQSKGVDGDSKVKYNIHYGSARPRKRLDVYRATPQTDSENFPGQGSSIPRISLPSPAASGSLNILPGPGMAEPTDLVLGRTSSRDTKTLSPVIVFIHSPHLGPIKGKKWMYESLGRNLADMGYTVVIPDVTLYPQGKTKQMVQDVRRVLNWTMINIRRHGGDPSQIHVIGHSLGGHLSLLTVLQEAIVVSRDKFDSLDVPMANGLRELKIYDREVRLPMIRGLMLLAPICDVNVQIEQETARGVTHLSKLRRILGPSHMRAMFHSPVHVLHAARNVVDVNLLPPKILFVHGGLDEEVPHFQSELMKELMHGVGLPFVRCKIYPVGHVDVVTAMMMNKDEPCSSSILEDLTTFMSV